MKKIIIGAIALACITGTVYAQSKTAQNTQRDLGWFSLEGGDIFVSRFVDPDNGNICYLATGVSRGGISCVKP